MLYIVLILVLAAFGLLILALTTAFTLWAWLSVIVSVAAAALLVYDWLGGRRGRKTDPAEDGGTETAGSPPATRAARAPAEPLLPVEPAEPAFQVSHHVPDTAPPVPPPSSPPPPPVQPVVADAQLRDERPFDWPMEPFVEQPIEAIDPDEEPGEEATDASDLLVVSELAVEVHVVDEHPHYHLTRCGWLVAKETIPLPVSEARDLGFTPCARCGPDATLAARHRAGH